MKDIKGFLWFEIEKREETFKSVWKIGVRVSTFLEPIKTNNSIRTIVIS